MSVSCAAHGLVEGWMSARQEQHGRCVMSGLEGLHKHQYSGRHALGPRMAHLALEVALCLALVIVYLVLASWSISMF